MKRIRINDGIAFEFYPFCLWAHPFSFCVGAIKPVLTDICRVAQNRAHILYSKRPALAVCVPLIIDMAHKLAQTHGATLTVTLRIKTKDQANDFRFVITDFEFLFFFGAAYLRNIGFKTKRRLRTIPEALFCVFLH
ncbi:MAG: hypothetical protein AAFO78_10755 [Pseudomonadota bacterium]